MNATTAPSRAIGLVEHFGTSALIVFGSIGLSLLVGCSTFLAVKDQQRMAHDIAVIRGTVDTDFESSSPLLVGTRGA